MLQYQYMSAFVCITGLPNNEAEEGYYTPSSQAIDLSPRRDRAVLKDPLRPGYGTEHPQFGDYIWINYVGRLENGSKFDSSYDRNNYFTFQQGYRKLWG